MLRILQDLAARLEATIEQRNQRGDVSDERALLAKWKVATAAGDRQEAAIALLHYYAEKLEKELVSLWKARGSNFSEAELAELAKKKACLIRWKEMLASHGLLALSRVGQEGAGPSERWSHA